MASPPEVENQLQSPPQDFVLPISQNASEDEISNVDADSKSISINDATPFRTNMISSPKNRKKFAGTFNYKRGLTYLVFMGALIVLYPPLVQHVQLKSQGKDSPFETDAFLCDTSVVSFFISVVGAMILFYIDSTALRKKCSSNAFYIILKAVFIFLAILAPLSLAMVLLIPQAFNWIAYLIISLLFVVVCASAAIHYKKLRAASDSEAVETNSMTLRHATVSPDEE